MLGFNLFVPRNVLVGRQLNAIEYLSQKSHVDDARRFPSERGHFAEVEGVGGAVHGTQDLGPRLAASPGVDGLAKIAHEAAEGVTRA